MDDRLSVRTISEESTILTPPDKSPEPLSISRNDSRRNQTGKKSSGGSLGRFEILETLGSGAFGVVYKANDPVLERTIALKIPKFGSEDLQKTKRFLTEAHAAASLKHPNIVAVYECGEVNGKPFIASEFVEGKPLSHKIKNDPPDFEESAQLLRSIAEGLAYAHNEGVIHRDIKPDNIMVADKNRPQIMDFGLAKLTEDDSEMTQDGQILGTPAYMSPEQAQSQHDLVGPKSDQYSLGVILYELLTGERPYSGPPISILSRVSSAEDSPESVSVNQKIPHDLSAICHRAMQKDPDKRYANCEEMAEDLSRWLSGIETVARPLSAFEKYRRWYRKNRTVARLWSALAVLAMVMVTIASVDYGRLRIVEKEQSENLTQMEGKLTETEKTLTQSNDDRMEAQKLLAINQFERGRNFCETGKLNEGLLWLSHSLENLSPDLVDLESPIRSYISSWLPQVHQLEFMIPHKDRINSIDISPDGKILMTGTGPVDVLFSVGGLREDMTPPGKGDIHFWDLKTGKPIPESITHDSSVMQACFSPDGKMAVSAGLDKELKIFDPSTGKEIYDPVKHPQAILSTTFNHDGTRVATGCLDGNVRIWDTATWKQVGQSMMHPLRFPNQVIHRTANPQPLITELAFTPDGNFLFVNANKMAYPFIKIWNLKTYQQIEYTTFFKDSHVGKFTSDGMNFLSLIENDVVLLRDWQSPEKKGMVLTQHGDLGHVDFNRTKSLFVSGGGDQTVWVYDYNMSKNIGQLLIHDREISALKISNDGQRIVTAGEENLLKIWKTASDKPWGKSFPHHQQSRVKFMPDNDRMIVHDTKGLLREDLIPGTESNRVRIWDIKKQEIVAGPYSEHGGGGGLDVSKDGRFYALGRYNSAIIRQANEGKLLAHINHGVNDVLLADNDQTLITGGRNKTIGFWDTSTGKPKGEPIHLEKSVSSLTLSPNGGFLLGTFPNNSAILWEMQTRKQVSEKMTHPKSVSCGSFHPDGSYLATGCKDGSVYFWSVPDGKTIKSPLYNYDRDYGIRSLDFTRDGSQIIVAGAIKGTQIWDLKTMIPASRRMMNGSWLRHTVLSPDGTKIATSNYSNTHPGSDIIIRNMPTKLNGSTNEIIKKVEKAIGLTLTEEGEIKVLDYEEWSKL